VVDQAYALIPFLRHSHDPLVETNLLVVLSGAECSRARYAESLMLAERAIALAHEMRCDSIEKYGLVARGHAEIGLRHFRDARRTIQLILDAGTQFDDIYLTYTAKALLLRIALAQNPLHEACPFLSIPADRLPKFVQGELSALLAVQCALAGDPEGATHHARAALTVTRSIESVFVARFALLSAKQPILSPSTELEDWLLDVAAAEAFDSFVLAYRAHPPLLALVAELHGLDSPFFNTVIRAHDTALAKRCGIALQTLEPVEKYLALLTPREREVLLLMQQGLTNAQIAKTLVIELSTAKSHVHNILKKLGVSGRLQAILLTYDEGKDPSMQH
jgi:DNA-binding CsgD family transcriptional regulator